MKKFISLFVLVFLTTACTIEVDTDAEIVPEEVTQEIADDDFSEFLWFQIENPEGWSTARMYSSDGNLYNVLDETGDPIGLISCPASWADLVIEEEIKQLETKYFDEDSYAAGWIATTNYPDLHNVGFISIMDNIDEGGYITCSITFTELEEENFEHVEFIYESLTTTN